MKITINEIKSIIEEELAKFLEKEKKSCREKYLECGDTVPCFEKFLECEKQASFRGVKAFKADKDQKQKKEKEISRGIEMLYKFIDENGGRVYRSDIPDELWQFAEYAQEAGSIMDVSDELEAYSLGEPPEGYGKLIDLIKKQYGKDSSLIPSWAVEEENGKYYWFDQDYQEEPMEVPKDLINFNV